MNFIFIWKNAKDTDTWHFHLSLLSNQLTGVGCHILPTPSETDPLTTGKLSRFMPSTKSKHPKN
jgi:hypothetical protein